jgi:hypothetical protein
MKTLQLVNTKEGCVIRFDPHRQRGPVLALQTRLQG